MIETCSQKPQKKRSNIKETKECGTVRVGNFSLSSYLYPYFLVFILIFLNFIFLIFFILSLSSLSLSFIPPILSSLSLSFIFHTLSSLSLSLSSLSYPYLPYVSLSCLSLSLSFLSYPYLRYYYPYLPNLILIFPYLFPYLYPYRPYLILS